MEASEPVEVEFTVTDLSIDGATASIVERANTMFGDRPYTIVSIKGVESDDSFQWTAKLVETRAPTATTGPPNIPTPARLFDPTNMFGTLGIRVRE